MSSDEYLKFLKTSARVFSGAQVVAAYNTLPILLHICAVNMRGSWHGR